MDPWLVDLVSRYYSVKGKSKRLEEDVMTGCIKLRPVEVVQRWSLRCMLSKLIKIGKDGTKKYLLTL